MSTAFQSALAYALDPKANPRPKIEIKPTPPVAPAVSPASNTLGGVRSRLLLFTALALMLLLPLGATWLLDLIGQSASASSLPSLDSHDQELTAQSGTISALFTQIAGQGDGLTFEQMGTAVAQTMAAYNGTIYPLESPTYTPPNPVEQTATALAGSTLTPSPSPSMTNTQNPTASPTSSATPTPTNTSTKTRTPAPTTSITPTKTADVTTTVIAIDPCDSFTIKPVVGDLYTVKWKLINEGPTVLITRLTLADWPSDHAVLIKVWLGGELIWEGTDTSPPSTIIPGVDPLAISSGSHVYILFRFEKPTAEDGYKLELQLNDNCTIADDRN
jgi:hypothetical protein